jgi:hypothetical protein
MGKVLGAASRRLKTIRRKKMKCAFCGDNIEEVEKDVVDIAININPETEEISGGEICRSCAIAAENEQHDSSEFNLSGEI